MPPDEEGMDQVSDLSDGDARIKEVFARFGLAVYISQVFEQGLINLLMISSYGIDVVTLEQRDDLEERLRRQTTGALFAQLRKKNVLSRQEAGS